MPQGMMDGILKQRMNLRKVSHDEHHEQGTGDNEDILVDQLRSINMNHVSEQEEYKKKVRDEQLRYEEEQRHKASLERLQRIEEMHQQDLERKQLEKDQKERDERSRLKLEQEKAATEKMRLLEEQERNRVVQPQQQPQLRNTQVPHQYPPNMQSLPINKPPVQEPRNMQAPPLLRPNMHAPPLYNKPPVIQESWDTQSPTVQTNQQYQRQEYILPQQPQQRNMQGPPQYPLNVQTPYRPYAVPPPVQETRSYIIPQTTAYSGDLQHLEDSLGDDLDFLDELDE